MQEVSRTHSTPKTFGGRGKPNLLSPYYITGFVDGEGCFCVSTSRHKTLKRKVEIRPEFEIELRYDDELILEKIKSVLGCGKIYQLRYTRYRWKPHVKYKVSNVKDLMEKVIPFFEKYPLQAKKSKTFKIFRRIVFMVAQKKHLTDRGYRLIILLREKMRRIGK